MLILLTTVLLLGTASALTVLRIARAQFRFTWLAAAGTTMAAWLSVLLWKWQPQQALVLPFWGSAESSSVSPAFAVSGQLWPYALGLVSLVLAVLLTSSTRPDFLSSANWASSLGFAGLGVLAVAAATPLTLVVLWGSLDLIELGLLIWRGEDRLVSRLAISAFGVRLSGIAAVLLALALSGAGSTQSDFAAISGPPALLLPFAAMLRLTALAIPSSSGVEGWLGREAGTTMELASAAASLGFLSRLGTETPTSLPSQFLLLLCAAAALYGGWMWLRAPDGIVGRRMLILGVSSLAVSSALAGNPLGATGWGVGLILAGGALALSSLRSPWLNGGLLLGAWSLSTLPWSLTASGWIGAAGAMGWRLPPLLLAQAMVVAGYIYQTTRPATLPPLRAQPAWLKGIYPAGIGLLLLLETILGMWGWEGALRLGNWVAGIVACVLTIGLIWAKRHIPSLNPLPSNWIPRGMATAMTRVRRETARAYTELQNLVMAATSMLEGEAGIMWGFLLLALFVSLFVGRKP